MGLFGKIATLAAIGLPAKAISASRGKTSSAAAGGTPPPPPPPAAGGGVKAKTGGPGPGSLGGIAAPGGQVQGQGRQMNAFRAGQPPAAPPSGSGMSVWEAGSQRRADNKTEL